MIDLAGGRSFGNAEYDPVTQRRIGHFGQTLDRYDTTVVRDRRGTLLRLRGCEGDQRGGNSEKSDADHRAFLDGLTMVVASQSYGSLKLALRDRSEKRRHAHFGSRRRRRAARRHRSRPSDWKSVG